MERGISVEQVSEFDRVLSVQPFWDADKLAKQLLVDKASGAPIAVAYELQADQDVQGLDCVPGIGLIGILFSLEPDHPGAVCCGALNQSKMVPLFGRRHILSCQFFPGEFTRIFGLPSNVLADTEIPLEDLLQPGTTPEQIACATSFEERIELTRQFISRWEARTRQRDVGKLIQQMMLDILRNHGDVRVNELAEQTGYSSRYLQKVMLEHVGLAPQTALANIRFQSALQLMVAEPGISVAEVAQRTGYYDQSHFTKVFKEYMKMTPAAFQEQLRKSFLPNGSPGTAR